MEDSLKISIDEETGKIEMDWDPEDPQWKFLNNLTEEQVQEFVMDSIKKAIEDNEHA